MPVRKRFITKHLQTSLVALLFIFLVLGVFHLFFPAAFAQVNCVITKVGNPKFPPPTNCDGVPENSTDTSSRPDPSPANPSTQPPGDSSSVLAWADKITAALQPNLWGFLNNMLAKICNKAGYCALKRTGNNENDLYWCTYLVIDTYNLIGKRGLSVEQGHGAVVNMMAFWRNQNGSGYTFLPYDPGTQNQNTLRNVRPGMAWFLANDPTRTINNEHTGLVKSITIDENGNGEMITLESNSDTASHKFIIDGWTIQNMPYALRGFGGA